MLKPEVIVTVPKVGDEATYCSGSDRYPYEVIEVSKSGAKITLRAMTYGVKSGSAQDGSAEYWYAPNPYGVTMVATLRKDGKYRRRGCSNYGLVGIGHARAYYDPHF